MNLNERLIQQVESYIKETKTQADRMEESVVVVLPESMCCDEMFRLSK